MGQLEGRHALITGGSRGIGRAIALAMANEGASVAINYRSNSEMAEATAAEARALGVTAVTIPGDVAADGDAASIVSRAMEGLGGLDIVVNNAGITRDTLLLRMSEDDWDAVHSTNLRGAFLITKAALRPLMKNRWGRIINLSSVVGVMGNPGQANYAAAKAGLLGFTRSIAREVASRNITVNALAPGFIETDITADLTPEQRETVMRMVPLGRFAAPEEVAPAAVFLASDGASYITGQCLHIDGGMVMT